MATRENQTSAIRLPLITGVSDVGEDILLNKNISGFAPELSDDDMLSIGEKLGKLYKYPLHSVKRVDTYVLKA